MCVQMRLLAEQLDTKARRVMRDAAEMRRLAAQIRDAIHLDTPTTEDTTDDQAQEPATR